MEVAIKVGTAEAVAGFASTPFAAAPNAVALLPEEVTAPLKLAFVVTVAAFPPMLSDEVATSSKALPSLFEYKRRLPVREVRPVPPVVMATVPVTLAEVPPMLSEEVATCRSAVPAALLYTMRFPVNEVRPVPP